VSQTSRRRARQRRWQKRKKVWQEKDAVRRLSSKPSPPRFEGVDIVVDKDGKKSVMTTSGHLEQGVYWIDQMTRSKS
jgi:hypothetical protein